MENEGKEAIKENEIETFLNSLHGSLGEVDNTEILSQLIKVVGAVVVSVSQQAQAIQKLAEGLDECMVTMDEGIFAPMEQVHKSRKIEELKGLINGEGRDFGKYSSLFKRLYDKELLDDVAERLLELEEATEEGEEFNRDEWLNKEYARLGAKFEGLNTPQEEEEEADVEDEEEEGGEKKTKGNFSKEELASMVGQRMRDFGLE